MQYNFRAFQSLLVYLLRYLHNGSERSILLQPVDAANGVILDDLDDNGNVHGLTIGGHKIELPFSNVLMVERQFKVTRFNGQKVTTETVSEAKVEKILDAYTDKKTGEVDSTIRNVEEVGNPDNRATRYLKDLDWS